MKTDHYQPLVHLLAVLTACVALLPIVVGALVTTKDAGMAFADWPSSDGHNMFLYPWLESAGAKFLEHGHRLAGALIGMISILLAATTWKRENRLWVRMVALAVLLSVIGQGILGGARVNLNERLLAMLHGNVAALVFALMAILALVTSRSWFRMAETKSTGSLGYLKPAVVLCVAAVFAQSLLGGMLRHLGMMLHEHIAVAVLVLLLVALNVVMAHLSRIGWLRRTAWLMLAVAVFQLTLGAVAFVTKYGFPPSGYVAVQHSLVQIVVRTSHTIVGILLFMTSVVHAVRVFRADYLYRASAGVLSEGRVFPGAVATPGGAP